MTTKHKKLCRGEWSCPVCGTGSDNYMSERIRYCTCPERGKSIERKAEACAPRIVQLLIAPQDATWQNRLLGLGSDGVTYAEDKGFWEPFVPPLGVGGNREMKADHED